MSELRRQAAEGRLAVGTTFRLTRTFSPSDVAQFGQITRDYNPVHYEPRWCASKGFARPICHGLLVGSMLCEPGGQWGWLATGMRFRFRRPVYVGDTITCTMTIVEIDERHRARGECVFTNQQGDVVLEAELEGYLPSPEEQQILSVMLSEGDPDNPLARARPRDA